ncbi:MAG: porin family protein [Mesorhizobium sp.]|nr:outer membrane protein [Mesorhizobium sp.]MBL8575612.1 porin family protein [Mesorhizobium sp.]
MRVTSALVALVAVGASPADAADAVIDEVVVVDTAYDWSGTYVGAHGGYSWGTSEFDGGIYGGGAGGVVISSHSKPDGALLGGYAGAQYQTGYNLVIGGELDFDYRDAEDTAPILTNDVETGVLKTEINWTASARLRAGYALDRWLPYVTGGLAWADIELGDSIGDTVPGWTVGLGAEYAFTDNLIFRGEYRYTDYDVDDDILIGDNPVGGAYSTFDLKGQEVKLGISYKF